MMILAFHNKAINFHNLERFRVHFKPGILISKLLIFINSKNLRTMRKLMAYENFQEYCSRKRCVLVSFVYENYGNEFSKTCVTFGRCYGSQGWVEAVEK